MSHMPAIASAALQSKMLSTINVIAAANGYPVPDLVSWHDKMLAAASKEMKAIRNVQDRPLEHDPAHASITTSTTDAQGDCPF